MSVKVAIRVRPFNDRQKFLGCTGCVDMKQNTTVVYQNRGKQKKQHYFTFDYSFWSHDGFDQKQDGKLVPNDNRYVDQLHVYKLLGQQILENAWVGFNCCLFAYGQTGAGKSYSMIGYGPNKGIIPMACQQLFDRMKRFEVKGERQYQLTISMLEIYNEKVQDLLINTNKRTANGLKIRQNKTLGVYVQGLNKFPVYSYTQIQRKMQQGSKNRSLASTLMNQYSSRAHTIVMLEFIQKQWITKNKMSKKSSLINLVDLAGSQRVAKTGVGDNKDRLKQASLINKSLHTLGRVIQALAELSLGKAKPIAVPYRESALTRILQNALGGNSKTTMICAISPANDNCQETLSTLRYADKTKKIKNKPVVNESEVDKLIRQLREQNQRLKRMLEITAEQQKQSPSKGLSLQGQQQRKQLKSNVKASMRQIQKQIRKNLQSFLIPSNELSEQQCEQSLMMTEFIDLQDPSNSQYLQTSFTSTSGKSQAYITNLNQDQMLNFKVKYSCQQELMICNNKANKTNHLLDPVRRIVLCGLGIQDNHARISKQNQKYFIQALTETSAEYTLLNGKPVYKKQQIMHNDRLILGTNSIFLFKNLRNPQERSSKKYTNQKSVGYEFAINQRQEQLEQQGISPLYYSGSSRKKLAQPNQQDKQLLKKLQQIQEQFNRLLLQNQRKTLQKQQKYHQQLKQLQAKNYLQFQQKQLLTKKLSQKKQQTYKLRSKQLEIQKLQKKLEKFQNQRQNRKVLRESMLLDNADPTDQTNQWGVNTFQQISQVHHNTKLNHINKMHQNHNKKLSQHNNKTNTYSPIRASFDDPQSINQFLPSNFKDNRSKNEKNGQKPQQSTKQVKQIQYDEVLLDEYDDKYNDKTLATTQTNTNANSTFQIYQETNFDDNQVDSTNQVKVNKKMKKTVKVQQFQSELWSEQKQLQTYNKIVKKYIKKVQGQIQIFPHLYQLTIYPKKKPQIPCSQSNLHLCKYCQNQINLSKPNKSINIKESFIDENDQKNNQKELDKSDISDICGEQVIRKIKNKEEQDVRRQLKLFEDQLSLLSQVKKVQTNIKTYQHLDNTEQNDRLFQDSKLSQILSSTKLISRSLFKELPQSDQVQQNHSQQQSKKILQINQAQQYVVQRVQNDTQAKTTKSNLPLDKIQQTINKIKSTVQIQVQTDFIIDLTKPTSQQQTKIQEIQNPIQKSNPQNIVEKKPIKVQKSSTYLNFSSVSDIDDDQEEFSAQNSLNFSSLNTFKQQQLNNQIQILKEKIKLLQTSGSLQKIDNDVNSNQSQTKQLQKKKEKAIRKIEKYNKNDQIEQQQQQVQPQQSELKKSQIKKRISQLPQRFSEKEFLKRRSNQPLSQVEQNMIICNNQNLLNQRNLQIHKRKRQFQQLKKSLFKKQRIQLQKQLFILIPMVEKFNLIAKDMMRLIQAKIEIQYRNFSHFQVLQALKNFMKSKYAKKDAFYSNVQIKITVANLQDARIYKWPVQVFKNRFEIAQELFQKHIQTNQNTLSHYNRKDIDKNKDPFWDPIDFVPNGVAYLSLQCLLFDIGYQGEVVFVHNSKIIAKAWIILTPVRVKKRSKDGIKLQQNHCSLEQLGTLSDLQISNPRNLLQSSLYFTLSIQSVCFPQQSSQAPLKFLLSYQLLIDDYKTQSFSTPQTQFKSYDQTHQINYLRRHCFGNVSQSTLTYVSDCPVKLTLALMKDYSQECLNTSFNHDLDRSLDDNTTVNQQSQFDFTQEIDALDISALDITQKNGFSSVQKRNQLIENQPDFTKKDKRPIIFENTQMMDKIDKECQQEEKRRKQKRQQKRKQLNEKQTDLKNKQKNLKKDDKDCTIY